MQKPQPNEHREYFSRYIDLVPEGEYLTLLRQNTSDATFFFRNIPAEKHSYQYADGKWTPKDILLHIIDTERIFTYRALAALRGDNKSLLPGYDENMYAENADTTIRTMNDLIEEFEAVRAASEKLFEHVPDAQSVLTANVYEYNTSVRALAYVIIGHTIHHMKVIQERYL